MSADLGKDPGRLLETPQFRQHDDHVQLNLATRSDREGGADVWLGLRYLPLTVEDPARGIQHRGNPA